MSTTVHAPPNQEKAAPEYATILELKERLGIEAAEVAFDDRLTLALVAAEIKLEEHLGRAFPDLGPAQLFSAWKSIGTGSIADTGEVSAFAPTSVELSKTDYAGNVFLNQLVDVTQLIMGDFVFDVTSFSESSTLWTFTGTVASGTFPVGGSLTEVLVGVIALDRSWIATVPETVHQKTLNIAMLEYKKGDSPTGIAGSDAFIGELDVAEQIRSELNDRTLLGLKVSWGVA